MVVMQSNFMVVKKTILYLVAAMIAALTSCQKETSDVVSSEEKLPIQLSLSLQTKVNDAGYENGDKIGVYVSYDAELAASGNYVDNKGFTMEKGDWTPDEEIYWADKNSEADLYCYYPYGTPVDATAYGFSVKSDQSMLASYAASDFLWGRKVGAKPGEGVVTIRTAHIMSNLLVYLVPGDGFTVQEFALAEKSIRIGNVKNNAIVNLATGVVTATGGVSVITPYWNGECYRAVVVPQTVASNSSLVVLTIAGVTYTLTRDFNFEAKTQHKLTITVNKTTSGLSVTVDSWIVDDTDYTGEAK
jgi:hypothetical protein